MKNSWPGFLQHGDSVIGNLGLKYGVRMWGTTQLTSPVSHRMSLKEGLILTQDEPEGEKVVQAGY